MSWAFSQAIRGNLSAQLASDLKSGGYASAAVVRRRASAAKRALRSQLVATRLGKLQNLVTSQATPARGPSLDAHAEVFARPLNSRGIDPLTVFSEGATVTVNGTQFLVIWEPAAGRVGTRRSTLQDLAGQVKLKRSRSGFVVVFTNDPRRIAFTLVPVAHIRGGRVDVDAVVAKTGSGIEDEIAFDWERRDARAGIVI